MEPNIDLIPAEERAQRSKEKAKKAALIACIVLFVFSAISSLGLTIYLKNFDSNVEKTQGEIDDKKTKIDRKADIEVSVKNLDSKYKFLSDKLSKRIFYSLFIDELSRRLPQTLSLSSVDSATTEAINISGEANDYISLAKFLNALANPELASSSANVKDENMIKEVVITSITLDQISSKARFNLNLSLDTSTLTKE